VEVGSGRGTCKKNDGNNEEEMGGCLKDHVGEDGEGDCLKVAAAEIRGLRGCINGKS
jgi:hypothetical protein